MLDLLSTKNALHTRMVDFTLQEYMFVVQVVLGERPEVAYANVYDEAEFNRSVPSEDEDDYLMRFKRDAEILLGQQQCIQLKEYLEQEYQIEVQDKASTLKDYKFTGAEVQKLLNNLLHDRSSELSEASVRDVLALIKSMYDSGALDSGDNFQQHFITIPKKYDILCPQCSRENYAVEGLDFHCPHCGMVARWSEEERRFFPQLNKL
jgi:hypothetical protein